jgi:hypothetical protein
MVIFKGQRLKPDWKRDMPPGTEVVMSGKGSMKLPYSFIGLTTLPDTRWQEKYC